MTQDLVTKQRSVASFLATHRKQLISVLPEHIKPERIMRLALNCISSNQKLLDCTEESLFGAVMECAKLGLEPGSALGHAHLIPFRNNKANRTEIQIVFGYQGLIDLATRDSRILTITPRVVYENDSFDIDYSLTFPLSYHKPCMTGPRGEVIGYYVVATFSNGHREFHFMTKTDVEEHRDKFCRNNAYYQGKPNQNSPWFKTFDAMAMKTVIRMMVKYLPKSIELSEAVRIEEASEAGHPQGLGDWIEGEVDLTPGLDEPSAPSAPALSEIPDNLIDVWTTIKDAYKGKNGKQEAAKLFAELPDSQKTPLTDHFNAMFKGA